MGLSTAKVATRLLLPMPRGSPNLQNRPTQSPIANLCSPIWTNVSCCRYTDMIVPGANGEIC